MSSPPALARRIEVVALGTLTAVPLLANAASAHSAVSSGDAVRGGEAGLLTFRRPNESAAAGTVTVTINLPADQPVAFADSHMVPGWTLSTTERHLMGATRVGDFTLTRVTSSVTWTAGRILGTAGLAVGAVVAVRLVVGGVGRRRRSPSPSGGGAEQ